MGLHRPRGGARPGAQPRPRAAALAAARRALRHQGHHRHGRPADRIQLRHLPRPPAEGRCGLRDAPQAGGLRDPRQDGHHRIRQQPSVADAQSAQRCAYARWLIQRLGRRGRRLHGAARARHADRRLGDPARRVLRRLCDQAELRRDQSRGHQVPRRVARHHRHLRAQRGRLGTSHGGNDRPRRHSSAGGRTAHWVVPHAALVAGGRRNASERRASGPSIGTSRCVRARLRAARGQRRALRPAQGDHGLRDGARARLGVLEPPQRAERQLARAARRGMERAARRVRRDARTCAAAASRARRAPARGRFPHHAERAERGAGVAREHR